MVTGKRVGCPKPIVSVVCGGPRSGVTKKDLAVADTHEQVAQDYEEVFLSDGTGCVAERSRLLRILLAREDHVSAGEL